MLPEMAMAAPDESSRFVFVAPSPRAKAPTCRVSMLLEMAMAPPAGLGTRIDRYRCCLPALAGFSI